jgi:hypothetical protein
MAIIIEKKKLEMQTKIRYDELKDMTNKEIKERIGGAEDAVNQIGDMLIDLNLNVKVSCDVSKEDKSISITLTKVGY